MMTRIATVTPGKRDESRSPPAESASGAGLAARLPMSEPPRRRAGGDAAMMTHWHPGDSEFTGKLIIMIMMPQ